MGTTAVVLGLASGSLSLLGFGFDAAIDAIASVALIWRFSIEAREPHRAARVEALAETTVGVVLLVLATYLGLNAAGAIISGSHPEATTVGTAILIASVVLLPALAVAKYRLAKTIASGALRADSILTAIAALLAMISLVGLGLSEVLGLWWGDAVGALLVTVVLVREGWASARAAQRGVEFGE